MSLKFCRGKTHGPYGNYLPWRQLEIMAVLDQPLSETHPAWTNTSLANEVCGSRQGVRLSMKSLGKRGWVSWAKDAFGRPSWVVTANGSKQWYMKLQQHVSTIKNIVLKHDKRLDFVRACIAALLAIRNLNPFGKWPVKRKDSDPKGAFWWKHTKALRALYFKGPWRILGALKLATREGVKCPGAYLHTLLYTPRPLEFRLLKYLDALTEYRRIPRGAQEHIAKQVSVLKRPLKAAKEIIKSMPDLPGGMQGRDLVDEYRFNKVKSGEWQWTKKAKKVDIPKSIREPRKRSKP